uniref:PUB domain-containing protein n=1 Tax=Attheya septentrionalis TaxID=420275 RepID=A0A7S2XMR4_9STRA|mmetsp:Transcript_14359/g.26099  ORF Transcript_14359/g.26099 Transcript_14359/m.26099 type:complete len:453 (+) Transcript_14359:161-1519(+)
MEGRESFVVDEHVFGMKKLLEHGMTGLVTAACGVVVVVFLWRRSFSSKTETQKEEGHVLDETWRQQGQRSRESTLTQQRPAKEPLVIIPYNDILPVSPEVPKEGGERVKKSAIKKKSASSATVTRPPVPAIAVLETQSWSPKSGSDHPGLDAFWNWCADIGHEYRVFDELVLPVLPRSERGNVSVELKVTNLLSERSIAVYWVNYKGKEVAKGTIRPGGTWHQCTYIGHPWTFRFTHDDTVVCHYVPFRLIPNTRSQCTITDDNAEGNERGNTSPTGVQSFSFLPPRRRETNSSGKACDIVDRIFPVDPVVSIKSVSQAIQWSLDQIDRDNDVEGARMLLKYLKNILLCPENSKRRKLRVSNVNVSRIWNIAGGRALLLALGFINAGPFIYLGEEENVMSKDRLDQLRHTIQSLETWQIRQEQQIEQVPQPEGALDGYGRAGYGRAGHMNNV